MLKKAIYIFITLLMVFSLLAGCSGNQAEKTQDTETAKTQTESTSPESTNKEESETENIFSGEITNILLMGSMNGDFSDKNIQNYALTHILITLDPGTQSIRFTTFPYNLKVKPVLEEGADETQLQFVYAQYGPDVLMSTLKARFGVEIDGWVIMNIEGVKSIVDELGGLKIDIKDLSINEMSQTVEDILGYVWYEIKTEGEQVLNGIQVSGYFMDTYRNLDEENPIADEEERFRERHEIIIDSLIDVIDMADMDKGRMAAIARLYAKTFSTNIKEKEWEEIAELALYCMDGGHEFLHVPIDIEVEQIGNMPYIIYSRETDVDAVKDFVYGN